MTADRFSELGCLREIMDERDRRYEQRFAAQQEAVRLAKEAAEKIRSSVSIVGLISVLGLFVALAKHFA